VRLRLVPDLLDRGAAAPAEGAAVICARPVHFKYEESLKENAGMRTDDSTARGQVLPERWGFEPWQVSAVAWPFGVRSGDGAAHLFPRRLVCFGQRIGGAVHRGAELISIAPVAR
jgi:hypothetical protein